MNPLKIYDYLLQSRARVLDAIRALSPRQYRQEFSFGLKTIAATITHIMISEWYYVERLEGRTVPAYEQWPIQYEKPPEFAIVEAIWRGQMPQVRAALAAQRDWSRKVAYDSFPDERGKRYKITATAGDIFTQLALHEVHHRAQIMAMLRQLGGPPLEDLEQRADVRAQRNHLTQATMNALYALRHHAVRRTRFSTTVKSLPPQSRGERARQCLGPRGRSWLAGGFVADIP